MSLATVNDRVGKLRDEADAIKRKSRIDQEFVTHATHLSESGKDAELGPIRDSLKTRLAELQAQEKKIVADEILSLERRVYGTVGSSPEAVISFRDAQERAERIDTPSDGLRAMQRSLTSNDAGLAQAILGRALELGWREVVDEYAASNPGVASAVSELATLRTQQNDIRGVIMQAMHYEV